MFVYRLQLYLEWTSFKLSTKVWTLFTEKVTVYKCVFIVLMCTVFTLKSVFIAVQNSRYQTLFLVGSENCLIQDVQNN